jgi:hypothetical protein
MDPSAAEQQDSCWSKGARIGRSGGHIVEAATTPPAATHRRTAASMEKAQPQQRRRLDPPLLALSHYPTLAGALRQLDGTGANGPRRPPAGAVRLRHAARPGSWPAPDVGVAEGGWPLAGRARIGRSHRPTTWHRDTSHPGATAHQDRRRAAAHQRSGQLDFGQSSKVRATARPGAALRRDMEDLSRRLAGAAGGQWR